MAKDHHKKRQKQIRMSDELRERFDKAAHASGLSTDKFVEKLLDRSDEQEELSKAELLAILQKRISERKIK